MRNAPDRSEERCSLRVLWRCATAVQRCALVAVGIVLVVLAQLSVLEPRLLAVTALAVLASVIAGTRLRQDLYRQRRLTVEAERGIRQLERWLASGEHA